MSGPFVTRPELAAIMGVSVRTIDTFRAEGMPCESWGLRAVRFDPERAVEWARHRGQNPADVALRRVGWSADGHR